MPKIIHPICPHCQQRIRPPLTPAQRARARERAKRQYERNSACPCCQGGKGSLCLACRGAADAAAKVCTPTQKP